MLKGLEAMINIQRQVKGIMKIAREINTMITEMEETILKANINNWTINATNILGISEDLWYLIQSNMENWVYQIQRMLADKLDIYRGKINSYVNNNIWEIQELYREKEPKKKEERIKDKEVILIKPYKISGSTSLLTKA